MKKFKTMNSAYYCLDVEEYLTADGRVWKREVTSFKRDTKETRALDAERLNKLPKTGTCKTRFYPLKKDQ